MNCIVANAEHARLNDSADADEQTSDGRPPHPMNRQLGKKIFTSVNQCGQKTRAQTCGYANQKSKDETFTIQHRVWMNGKDRPGPEKRYTNGRSRGGSNCHRNKWTRPPLEKQQFDSQ